MRSGCDQLPSWTFSLAWIRWGNLSGLRCPCYPVCQKFLWTKCLSWTQPGRWTVQFNSSSWVCSSMSQVQLEKPADNITGFFYPNRWLFWIFIFSTILYITICFLWLMTALLGWYVVHMLSLEAPSPCFQGGEGKSVHFIYHFYTNMHVKRQFSFFLRTTTVQVHVI